MYQIMLVEDEMLVRESMAQNTNWDKFGFAPPHVFENGRQALEQLESVLPDVVITDICMPEMDGLQFMEEAAKENPGIKVILLTGYAEFEYARKALTLGALDYLLKPLNPDRMRAVLEKAFQEISEERLLASQKEEMRKQLDITLPIYLSLIHI